MSPITLYHTAISSLSPQSLYGGRVSYPSYNIAYKQATPPSQYEGLELLSSAVVYAPDSFSREICCSRGVRL